MRSRIVSTLAALAAATALTVGAAGVLGSAHGGSGSGTVSHQAGKIMPRGGS